MHTTNKQVLEFVKSFGADTGVMPLPVRPGMGSNNKHIRELPDRIPAAWESKQH
ncbi:hypothetical protein BH11PSE11_BH11PSE11_38370 [soil metagenome]